MNKLLIGGAVGVLLIAGQAIAARLPEMIAAPAIDPVVATAVAADPAVLQTARAAATPLVIRDADLAAPLPTFVADRLDPGKAADPVVASGDSVVAGGLTEAETARLAVRQDEVLCSKFGWKCRSGSPLPAFLIGGFIAATAFIVARDDDSDS